MSAVRREQGNLTELIAAHESRLRRLQVQAARQGIDTPPQVLNEIEQIEHELAQLRSASAVRVSDDLVESLGPTGRYQLWMAHITRLDTDIHRLGRRIDGLDQKLDRLMWRMTYIVPCAIMGSTLLLVVLVLALTAQG